MNCLFCEQPYNLTHIFPYTLPCCGETACKDCIMNAAGVPQEYIFSCPIADCRQENQNQNNLMVTKAIERILKQALGIHCEEHLHLNEQGEYFCLDHQAFIRTGCAFSKHNNHESKKIIKQDILNHNNKLLEFLRIEYERIGQMILGLELYSKNERQFTSSQYLKLINEISQTITPRLNEQQKLLIQFLPNSQYQIEQQQQNVAVNNSVPSHLHPVFAKQIKQAVLLGNSELNKNFNPSFDSKLITNEHYSKLQEWFSNENLILDLIYRGSFHGQSYEQFHEKCDNQGPTQVVIRSQHNKIFGGYTSISWTSPIYQKYLEGSEAFLFSLTNKTKLKQVQNKHQAVYHSFNFGPTFGGGNDLFYNCDKQIRSSYSDLGFTYELPAGINFKSNDAQSYLAGSLILDFKLCEKTKMN